MKKNLIYSLTAIGLVMGSEAVGEVAKIPQGFVPCPKGENINVGMLCAGKSFTVKYKTSAGDMTEELWKLDDKSPARGAGALRFITKKNKLKAKHKTDGKTCRYMYATFGGDLREVWLVPANKQVGIWGNEDTTFIEGKGKAKAPAPEAPKEKPAEDAPACPAPPSPPPMPTDLAKVNFPPPPPPLPSSSPASDGKKTEMPKPQEGRGALLDQIKQGKGLKKVDKKERKSPVQTDMASALATAVKANRAAHAGDDSDDEDWD